MRSPDGSGSTRPTTSPRTRRRCSSPRTAGSCSARTGCGTTARTRWRCANSSPTRWPGSAITACTRPRWRRPSSISRTPAAASTTSPWHWRGSERPLVRLRLASAVVEPAAIPANPTAAIPTAANPISAIPTSAGPPGATEASPAAYAPPQATSPATGAPETAPAPELPPAPDPAPSPAADREDSPDGTVHD